MIKSSKKVANNNESQIEDSSSNFKMSPQNPTSNSSNFGSIVSSKLNKHVNLSKKNEHEEKNETSMARMKQTLEEEDEIITSQGSSRSASIKPITGHPNTS